MPENLSEFRSTPVEFREAEGTPGIASGIVIRYGDEASFAHGLKERFEAGAFGDLRDQDLRVNRMHLRHQPLARSNSGNPERGGMLTLDNDLARMYAEILMPDTQLGRDTCTELRLKLLRGLSLEFRSLVEDMINGVRVIKRAKMFGFGVVDQPAYPGSMAEMRSWEQYFDAVERRVGFENYYDLSASGRQKGGCRGCVSCGGGTRGAAPTDHTPEPEMRYVAFDCEIEARNGVVRIRMPYGDDAPELRVAPREELDGRLPYGVDGVVSMQRGELVRFLPGCFTDSLGGEIILLAGNSYEEPLANSQEGTLRLRDNDEALEFEARDLPDTTYAHNFLGKLQRGLIRGLTAGWANAGSDTETEDLPDGRKRIVVRKAMLCEFYPRSRSVAPGGGVQARTGRRLFDADPSAGNGPSVRKRYLA